MVMTQLFWIIVQLFANDQRVNEIRNKLPLKPGIAVTMFNTAYQIYAD
jgi:hypothetical protein